MDEERGYATRSADAFAKEEVEDEFRAIESEIERSFSLESRLGQRYNQIVGEGR